MIWSRCKATDPYGFSPNLTIWPMRLSSSPLRKPYPSQLLDGSVILPYLQANKWAWDMFKDVAAGKRLLGHRQKDFNYSSCSSWSTSIFFLHFPESDTKRVRWDLCTQWVMLVMLQKRKLLSFGSQIFLWWTVSMLAPTPGRETTAVFYANIFLKSLEDV